MTDLINQNTIDMLRDLLEAGFGEVIDAFLTDTPKRLQEAQSSAACADLAALERATHAIKGSSSNIGATLVNFHASSIVDACRSGNLPDPVAAVSALIQAFEQTKPQLEALK